MKKSILIIGLFTMFTSYNAYPEEISFKDSNELKSIRCSSSRTTTTTTNPDGSTTTTEINTFVCDTPEELAELVKFLDRL